MRGLWIQRINAAARQEGMTYGHFIHGLKELGLAFDRKILADMAFSEPSAFVCLVEKVKGLGSYRQVAI
jgi:large subunit ribosomal protein L20